VAGNDSLGRYRRKRDFTKTPEPSGRPKRGGGKPRFVIQKHDATTLHYDVRLEVDGVLKSWAVPKGPSTDPRDKRLAMPTEDHPMEYETFEGVIPEGEYGAGPVIVWDRGTYVNLTEKDGYDVPVKRALRDGHLKVWLEGQKLRGGYALTRARIGGSNRAKWLLVKLDDEGADRRRKPVSTQPRSVISNRTVEELSGHRRGRARGRTA
jgi:DNA ligase D-like protein (predicted 3'-phosphoesterase)